MNLKVLFAAILMIIVFVINLFRGSGKRPSIIGNQRCSSLDFILLGLLTLEGIIGTVIAAKWVNKGYLHKQSIGYTFIESEMQMNRGTIVKLAILGFFSGFM